jgi:hypothetical protein
MPGGKAAGQRCAQLASDNRCHLFGRAERPAVCVRLQPSADMCGQCAEEALTLIAQMESTTRPL